MAVPDHVAKILTYPERVNKANIELLRKLVQNGTDKHPGANFIQQRDTNFKKSVTNSEQNSRQKYRKFISYHVIQMTVVVIFILKFTYY